MGPGRNGNVGRNILFIDCNEFAYIFKCFVAEIIKYVDEKDWAEIRMRVIW